MKKISYKIIVITFYILFILSILFYIKYEFTLTRISRTLVLLLSCLFLYISNAIIIKNSSHFKNKVIEINLWIFLILYLTLIISLTLYDKSGLETMNWSFNNLKIYLQNRLNIIPFKTIIELILETINQNRSVSNLILNILGNILAFTPFALFIPLLFPKINSLKKFTITMVLIVTTTEILQLITLNRSCDIDDIILNVIGSLILYQTIKIPYINKLIKQVFLFEK